MHDKDIVTTAFGDLAFVIEHERFGTIGIRAFDFGEDVIQVIQ